MTTSVGNMYGRSCLHLLSVLGVIASLQIGCIAFNIDTAAPGIYNGDEKGFFGHKVLQFSTASGKGFMVTAPLQQNGSGGIYSYMKDSNKSFTPKEAMPVKLLGMSLAKEPQGPTFTICSPSVAHHCYDNSYLGGQCYQLSEELKFNSTFKPDYQECTKNSVDLVFLFDGSSSMTEEDFAKNKDFIQDIMNTIKNSSIKFAAVQFSSEIRVVFNFNDYTNGKATELLKKEPFMAQLTNTYRALHFTLETLFENRAAGAVPGATKVLVIITDGDPSDKDEIGIVKKYDEKNIIRFVIGVKNVDLKKLRAIASEPKRNNTFAITAYAGLAGILKNFEEKIFNIEDSPTALSQQFKYEMSQSGFSSVYHKGMLVLGSVGSNGWSGSLYEVDVKSREPHLTRDPHIEDPKMGNNSYMGYSVAAGEKDSVSLYFTGAPRFEHTGEVVVFRKTNNSWKVVQRVAGEQIGSYFGVELCLVDVQSDGNADFLLVGAPMFHHHEKSEGQIYIYNLTSKLELERVLNVSVPSRGRFGMTISSLADLNGDGLRDVAVGAPLEDNNRGAVYIYLGNKHTGIRRAISQRITADPANTWIRFFGQAVDGQIDLGEDGLPDLVVGSRGAVFILKSKAVVNVKARLQFEPAKISTVNIRCPETLADLLPMVTLTVCFDLEEVTRRRTGTASAGLNISYTLEVDPMKPISRGLLRESSNRKHEIIVELMASGCFNHSIDMPKCVQDTLSPIDIKMTFAQHEIKQATSILNADSPTWAATEVPFEKNCRANDTCIAELEVDFTFTTPTLVVVNHNNFNVNVTLSNLGDDSFNTKLLFDYPQGLSFSKLNVLTATRSMLSLCKDLVGVLDHTECGVSLPVYHSGTNATFQALFRIMDSYDWKSNMSLTITGKSDNNNVTYSSMTKSIPVQYQIDLTVAVNEESITYLNFTIADKYTQTNTTKKVDVIYEVKNLGFKAFPIYVYVTFPIKMDDDFEMNNYKVVLETGKCVESNTTRLPESFPTNQKCKTMECKAFDLDKYSTIKVIMSGELSFKDLQQRAKNISLSKLFTGETLNVTWNSIIEVNYDKQRYVQASSKQSNDTSFPRAQPTIQIELIIPPQIVIIAMVGGSMGLLLLCIIALVLYKMGYFKRKTMQYYQEQEDPDEDVPLKTVEEMALLPESREHAGNGGQNGCSESPVEGPTAPTE